MKGKMMISRELQSMVEATRARWDRESALHFCRLARKAGVTFENVIYPTGLRNVIARADGQKAEVSLSTAKALRADGYMLRDRA